MKKSTKITLALILFALTLLISTTVNAASLDDLVNDNFMRKESDGSYKLLKNLTGSDTKDIEIKGNKTETLDLNNFNINNYSEGLSTIYIEKGSTLTIKGNGTISQKASSTNAVIGNSGTLNIQGGEYTTSLCNAVIRNEGTLNVTGGKITNTYRYSPGDVNAHYLIENFLDLTIGGNAQIVKPQSTSSAIGNMPGAANAKITVNGGTLESQFDLIRNYEGNVEITNGTLKTQGTGNVIKTDSGSVTVTGGVLETTGNADSVINVSGDSNIIVTENAKLKASGDKAGVYVQTGATGNVQVDSNAGKLATATGETFTTIDGKQIVGEYKDITFVIIIDDKEFTGDTLNMVVGEKTPISVKAYLGGHELVNKISIETENEGIIEFNKDKNEISAISTGTNKLSFSYGSATKTINVAVTKDVLDNTPKTGEISNILNVITVIAVLSFAGIVIIKKTNRK